MNPEERLDKLFQEFPSEVYAEDPLAMLVIKSHLLIEHYLNGILERIAHHPQFLDLDGNTGFAQKVKWVRAFTESGLDKRWDIVTCLNALRNKVAHKFKGTERETALSQLRLKVIRFNTQDDLASDDSSFESGLLIDVAAHICISLLFPILRELVAKAQREPNHETGSGAL